MNAKKYERLEEMLCKEVEKIVDKGELSAGSLDTVDKLMHALKNTYKVHMGEEGEYSQSNGFIPYYDYGMNAYEGNSQRGSYGNGGNSYGNGGYSRADNIGGTEQGGSYGDSSYARGRGRYAKRDSMGRYSSADGKEEMISRMEEMMSMAGNDREREALRNCMQKLEQM